MFYGHSNEICCVHVSIANQQIYNGTSSNYSIGEHVVMLIESGNQMTSLEEIGVDLTDKQLVTSGNALDFGLICKSRRYRNMG